MLDMQPSNMECDEAFQPGLHPPADGNRSLLDNLNHQLQPRKMGFDEAFGVHLLADDVRQTMQTLLQGSQMRTRTTVPR